MDKELPANSHKAKEESVEDPKKKTIEKVVSGEVTRKPPSLMAKFKHTFFNADFGGVVRYLAEDVLAPALRNLIVDTATKGVERAIYGDVQPRRRSPGYGEPRFRYDTPMRRENIPESRKHSYQERSLSRARPPRSNDVGDILVSTKSDADRVIERLHDIIEEYQMASVADLYELLGVPSTHVDNRWGWTQLPLANAIQTRDGYLINLPPVEQIDV